MLSLSEHSDVKACSLALLYTGLHRGTEKISPELVSSDIKSLHIRKRVNSISTSWLMTTAEWLLYK